MNKESLRGRGMCGGLLAIVAALGSGGCSSDEAPKAWSSVATCLAGETATGPLPARIKRLRLAQLGAADGSKEPWPARCMSFANQLHAALPDSGKPAMLRRKMEEKLGCEAEKASCKLANDDSLIPTTTLLWEAAKDSELVAEPSAEAGKPPAATEPPITQQTWKALTDKPTTLDGPWLAPDGRALFLLRDAQGKGKPTGCELPPGFAKLTCTPPNASVPELPLQTVRLVAEGSSIYAAGLTEKGLVAYDLKTGKSSGVRGSRPLAINGLIVEESAPPAAAAPAAGAAPAAPDAAATPALVAVMMKDGNAGNELKLSTAAPSIKPIALHDHVVWVERGQDANELVIEAFKGGRLQRVAAHKGVFKGGLRTCDAEGTVGVAVWDKRADMPNAKPTHGADDTELTVIVLKGDSWSKPLTATLPFKRVTESDLVCTKDGVSVTWTKVEHGADPLAAGEVEVGRVDCNAEGCKSSSEKLPGVDSKYWWAVAPMSNNVLMLWRTALGDTRFRLAPLSGLASAPDKLLFDSSEFGGPIAKDLTLLISSEGALLLFRDERPVAMHVGKDGSFGLLGP